MNGKKDEKWESRDSQRSEGMYLVLCKKCSQFTHEETKTDICHERAQDAANLEASREFWLKLVEHEEEKES